MMVSQSYGMRTSASASRGLQSIKGFTPIKQQNIEELSESDSESTCSRCSLRGKCSAQDGVCDGQTAEEAGGLGPARPVGGYLPYS